MENDREYCSLQCNTIILHSPFSILHSPYETGFIVGFDGTDVKGKNNIEKHLAGVFAQHKTASYVSVVRSIQFISPDVVVLLAVAGMVPPGKSAINADTNAVQTAIIKKSGNEYRLIVFQNTPAAYHGRPEASEGLTRELQKQLSFSRDSQ